MSPRELRYTEHAFSRMTERDITRSTVEAVVAAGDVEIERDGVHRYTLEGLVVVVDGNDVVTAYYDSDTLARSRWGIKKKQRRCRPKQHKATYIPGRGKINISLSQAYLRQMESR